MINYINISKHTTFGVPAWVKAMYSFQSIEELQQLLTKNIKDKNLLILGGGSNLLFTQPFDGVVLKNELKGITVIDQNEDLVFVKASAGEVWHTFVQHAVDNNWGGIENLSLIPGSVGASPMQNIGAYGVEIKDVFHSLEALEISSGKIKSFDAKTCAFGYRESIFKRELKNKYIIISVTFVLHKNPKINTSYGAINDELSKMGITTPNIKDVSQAVINIRQSKLPNPAEIGNAGSFFKNPVVKKEVYNAILQKYPNAPAYPINEETVKIPAGWLIENAGWKGKTEGEFGVHKNQALVLVNYGNADGKDILNLSSRIISSIESLFNITLEREVNIM